MTKFCSAGPSLGYDGVKYVTGLKLSDCIGVKQSAINWHVNLYQRTKIYHSITSHAIQNVTYFIVQSLYLAAIIYHYKITYVEK